MTNSLALKVPGFSDVYNGPPGLDTKFPAATFSIGFFITQLLPVLFYISAFLVFVWMIWGGFEWLFSSGDKTTIARARKRITYALIGFAIMLLALFFSNYIQDIIKPQNLPVKDVTPPPITFHLITPAYAQAPTPLDLAKEYPFGNINSLGEGIGRLVRPAFSIAATALVFYIIFAGFTYVTSGGDKEAVAASNKMVTNAIIGFIILMFSFLILGIFLDLVFGIKGAFNIISPWGP